MSAPSVRKRGQGIVSIQVAAALPCNGRGNKAAVSKLAGLAERGESIEKLLDSVDTGPEEGLCKLL
jgi:hypothetical protein